MWICLSSSFRSHPSLTPPAYETHNAKAGAEKWESGWEGDGVDCNVECDGPYPKVVNICCKAEAFDRDVAK